MRSVSQFSTQARRKGSSERAQRSAVATGSPPPAAASSSPRRTSCGDLRPPPPDRPRPRPWAQCRAPPAPAPSRPARASPRARRRPRPARARGIRTRWQRLRMVAGRREGWLRDQDQQRALRRLLQSLERALAAKRFMLSAGRQHADLVAALVSRQGELRGELADLLDPDLRGGLERAHAWRDPDAAPAWRAGRPRSCRRAPRRARAEDHARRPARQPLAPRSRRLMDQQRVREPAARRTRARRRAIVRARASRAS